MSLQNEIDKMDCAKAERALASIATKGSAQYYFLFNFIDHVRRLQTVSKLPALLKGYKNVSG